MICVESHHEPELVCAGQLELLDCREKQDSLVCRMSIGTGSSTINAVIFFACVHFLFPLSCFAFCL